MLDLSRLKKKKMGVFWLESVHYQISSLLTFTAGKGSYRVLATLKQGEGLRTR